MARRFRRLHRLREEVVKITRRFFRFCYVCGTVEQEVRTDIVPVRKLMVGNLSKACFGRSPCDHGQNCLERTSFPERYDDSGFCSTDNYQKHFASESDLSLSDISIDNDTKHDSGNTKPTQFQTEYSNGEFWHMDYLSGWKVNRTLSDGKYGPVELVSFSDIPKRYVLKTRDVETSVHEFSSMALCQSRFVADLCASVTRLDKRLMFIKNYKHGDLGQLLARDKFRDIFNENIAVWTAANLYAGVDYLHGNGILHLNVTPANILIDEHGYAVLTGFSNARHWQNCTSSLEKKELTTAYASPEVLDKQLPDKMADLWAIACCLYEIIKGRSPFLGRSEAETELKVSMGCVINFYGLSSDALNFITCELHIYRNRRIGFRGGMAAIRREPIFAHIDWDSFRYNRLPACSPILAILPSLPEVAPTGRRRKPSKLLCALQNEETSCDENCDTQKKSRSRRRLRRRAANGSRKGLFDIEDGYLGGDEIDADGG